MEDLGLLGLFDAMPDFPDVDGQDHLAARAHDVLAGSGEDLGSSLPPSWWNVPSAANEDWDHDGIPNYADRWFGPGWHDPFHDIGTSADVHAQLAHDAETVPAAILFDDVAAMTTHHDLLGALTVGDPYADAPYWHLQEDLNSCAVASQASVLESLLHREVSESELARIAYEHGWFDPASGTPSDAVGSLLEYYGVPVERGYDTALTDVFEALLRGDKVIVALDANEIWEPNVGPDGQPVELPDAGHAVWVTGMHEDDDGKWTVIMNDTGTPDGCQRIVSLPDFMNAWEDFGRFSAITQAPEENPHVA